MSRSTPLRACLGLVVIALLGAALGAASASATELVKNGGFESGTLESWKTSYETEEGEWFAYSRKEFEKGAAEPFSPSTGEFANRTARCFTRKWLSRPPPPTSSR